MELSAVERATAVLEGLGCFFVAAEVAVAVDGGKVCAGEGQEAQEAQEEGQKIHVDRSGLLNDCVGQLNFLLD